MPGKWLLMCAVAEGRLTRKMLPSGREWPDGRGGGVWGLREEVPALLLEDCCQGGGSRTRRCSVSAEWG